MIPTVEQLLAYATGDLPIEEDALVREALVANPRLALALVTPFPTTDDGSLSAEEVEERWRAFRVVNVTLLAEWDMLPPVLTQKEREEDFAMIRDVIGWAKDGRDGGCPKCGAVVLPAERSKHLEFHGPSRRVLH